MRADRTVITFRALPSMVTAKTTRTGGSEENYGKERNRKKTTSVAFENHAKYNNTGQKAYIKHLTMTIYLH